MKKHFLKSNRLPLLWVIFHAGLLLALGFSLAFGRRLHFNTSLFDILPPSHSLKSAAQADAELTALTSRSVTILAYAPDFSLAKGAAEDLYACYKGKNPQESFFEDITLYVDSSATRQLKDFLHEHRFSLLDRDTVSLLQNGGAEEVVQDALSRIYSAFSFTDFSGLETDPFDLTGGILQRFLSAATTGASMSVKDDVLAAQKDGFWYVMLRGRLSPDAISLTGKKSAVRDIYSRCEEISRKTAAEGNSGVQFAFSGVPFHSYESSSSAQRQVSVISTIGMLLVILLFLYVFRSLVPALISAGAVALSCGLALASVLLIFGQIHVLTFVFGTTLIGTCVDYSIHFFVHWKNDASLSDGAAIRRKILRGIGISFASTEICFAALFLAPFPFLKQVSVFLFTGLMSAFLGVICLYPLLPLPAKRSLPKEEKATRFPWYKIVRPLPLLLAVFSLFILFISRKPITIDNNLRDMYSMSPRLFESEKIVNQVLDYGSAGWYFLAEGESAESLLQTEEAFSQKLAQAQKEGKLGSFLSTSAFIPSKKTQAQSYDASSFLLALAGEQYSALGFAQNVSDEKALSEQYAAEYQQAKNVSVSPEARIPDILSGVTRNLWLGEINGRYYSCILPLHARDADYFRSLTEDFPSVHFVNKSADIASELNSLTATMLKLLAAAFLLVLVILFFCYPPKTVARIAAIPLLVVLVTLSVLTALHISLGFFSVTGLVLTFGLGLDYIIYAIEGEKSAEKLNNLAILISFATTALSFGALALIDFAPVHTIGVAVFSGLTTACLCAFGMTAKK